MFGLHFKTLLPAIIFALCILEMSFGLSFRFHVVWWFYFYFVWSLINFNGNRKADGSSIKFNTYLIVLYLLSCLIYTLHHFLGKEFYEHSTSETFNILWWTVFGALLVYQIKKSQVNHQLFNKYVRNIVFFGCFISASLGILKYVNILSGRYLNSFFYDNNLLPGSSLSTDYNVYSLGLTIGALMSIGFYRQITKTPLKFLYILTIGIIIGSILLSGSRRGVLMSGFILFCLAYSHQIMNARKQMNLFTIFGVPIILIFLINNNWDKITVYLESTNFLDESITRVLSLKQELQNENERTTRFSWSLDYFFDRSGFEQLFGNGFEYLRIMGNIFSGEIEDNPHNYLLSSLLYGGILSLIISLFMSYELILSSFNHHRVWYPIVLVVFAFGLSSSNSLFALRIFPTLIFILSLRIQKIKKPIGLFTNEHG
jgi:hypothetical protein